MACDLCEHCHAPVYRDEPYSVREGCSYHEKCHKCYVCSETNLQDAEVFKGVIFCSSCSQRIFQGCSTARRQKTGRRDKGHKRRGRSRPPRPGILALTRLAVSSTSGSSLHQHSEMKSKVLSDRTSHTSKKTFNKRESSIRKSSVEMGMTTEVTQELLEQMNCPVVTDCRKPAHFDKPNTKTEDRKRKKQECSDLRVAELGASTEIANMALKNKSELPVIIRSDTGIGKMGSFSVSALNQESVDSERRSEWIDSVYSSLAYSTKTPWMDRRFSSILKIPFNAFKRNILNRSSIVNELIRSQKNDYSMKRRIKLMFYEEITDHQRKGLQRLYSTINRKKTPRKLGWLECVGNLNESSKMKRYHNRCRHFRNSHSYRCMRSQVMKLAGPTTSELAQIRCKLKSYLAPTFIRNMSPCNKKYAATLMSQACGNSSVGAS